MTPKTRKAKGAAFEKACLEELKKLDPKAYRVFGSGAGLQKGDLYLPSLNIVVEAKNHRNINLKGWIQQLERQGNDYNKSLLLFKNPASADINPEIYATLSLYDLMELLKVNVKVVAEEKVVDRQKKYDLDNLIIMAKKVIKNYSEE